LPHASLVQTQASSKLQPCRQQTPRYVSLAEHKLVFIEWHTAFACSMLTMSHSHTDVHVLRPLLHDSPREQQRTAAAPRPASAHLLSAHACARLSPPQVKRTCLWRGREPQATARGCSSCGPTFGFLVRGRSPCACTRTAAVRVVASDEPNADRTDHPGGPRHSCPERRAAHIMRSSCCLATSTMTTRAMSVPNAMSRGVAQLTGRVMVAGCIVLTVSTSGTR